MVQFLLLSVAAGVVAAVLNQALPYVLQLVKPYAVRAAGVVPSKWRSVAAAFALGCVVGSVLANGLPSISIPWPDWKIPSIVTPAGPRRILIVRETADATPQLNGELILLRKDPIAAYLTSKGHRLDILDLDAKDKDGAPIKAVTEFKTNYATLKPPAILIQAENNAVVHAASLPADVKAAAILETIKAKE